MSIQPIYLKIGPNWPNRQCCLAGSSKTAPRILIFLIAIGADYSFDILCEIHCYLCPHIFWVYYFSLSQCGSSDSCHTVIRQLSSHEQLSGSREAVVGLSGSEKDLIFGGFLLLGPTAPPRAITRPGVWRQLLRRVCGTPKPRASAERLTTAVTAV